MRKKFINLEITNKCSNFCPGCVRQTVYNNKNIPGSDLSLDNMKKIVSYFDKINFCGQISDPILHNDFYSILKLCIGKEVYIRTSATPKPIEDYIRLFEISSKYNYSWIFGMDGLPSKNNLYRVNQDGILLFEIMKLGILYGVNVTWSFINFKFNEGEIDMCKKLAFKHDIKFEEVLSSRWYGEMKKFKPENLDSFLNSLY